MATKTTMSTLATTRALLKKLLAPTALALALIFTQAQSALACGGLVAPDGDVRLARASTLIAWHDGIEHYLTSFSYQGNEAGVGWIVPLPAVPLSIVPGGRWTLQRLFNETHPIIEDSVAFGAAEPRAAANSAQVLQQVQIEALNITVLRGSGQAVIDWCAQNGFFLSGDTRAHLLAYANATPIFMASKYDLAAAKARGQQVGDGAAILITMKTPRPWVPLEVLALDGQQVQADLYFLTDQPLNTSAVNATIGQSSVGSQIPGALGFQVAFQERVGAQLYHDLSTDRNMNWVRADSWLTYLSLDAPDSAVNYDLSVTPAGIIHLQPFATAPFGSQSAAPTHDIWSSLPHLPLGTPQFALTLLVVLLVGLAITWMIVGGLRREARQQAASQAGRTLAGKR